MESVIIGIDLGGTNLRIGAVTPDNRMLAPRIQLERSARLSQAI